MTEPLSRLLADQVHSAVRAHGFQAYVSGQGGGTLAIEVTSHGYDRYLLITDGDADLPLSGRFPDRKYGLTIGQYGHANDDDDQVIYEHQYNTADQTIIAAVAVAETWATLNAPSYDWTITETINHGNYHNVATHRGDTLAGTVLQAVTHSPYNADASNEQISVMTSKLVAYGHAQLGWADYVLTERPTIPHR